MRKKAIAMFFLLGLNILSKIEIVKNKTIKNNIVYLKESSTPFTGEIVGENLREEYKNGIKDGKFKGIIVIDKRKKIYEGNYKNGIKNGVWLIRDLKNSDKIEAKLEYLYDKPVGSWEYYDENNRLTDIENFSDGVLMGETVSYDHNGNILKKLSYKNGVLDGEVEIYNKNGNLESKASFKNGKIDGEIIIYGLNENCLLKGEYNLDKRVKKWYFYYKTGEIKIIVPYKNGLKHGQVVIYDKAGLIVQKNYFSRGDELDKKGELLEKYSGFDDGIINKYKKINKNLKYIKYNERLGEI